MLGHTIRVCKEGGEGEEDKVVGIQLCICAFVCGEICKSYTCRLF